MVVFVPEKRSAPAISSAQATKLVSSIFAPNAYALASRYNEYSSGAIKMTGVGGDPNVTVKYLTTGVDSCDRGAIIDAVYKAIAPAKPSRVIVAMNVYKQKCSGYADNSGTVTMAWTLYAMNPHVMFHELGHSLSFPHPATSLCYSNRAKVMMSSNCTSVNGDDFQNMGVISHDQPWFKADGVTNVESNLKGSMEYSSYNRLSSDWPMLKEANVLDVSGSGTYKIYNSETASIGTKPALLRIPLNPPIKIANDMVSSGVTYHTHYYVDFTQRRPNTSKGGLINYVVVRTAPDHRAKRSYVTRFMSALSTSDRAFGTSFYDGYRMIRIKASKIDSTGATLTVTFPSKYTLPSNVNQCYYSAKIDAKHAVTVNNNNVCRGLSRDNLPTTGTFNGTHCLIPYSNVGHIVPMPKLEFLHCLNTPKWITTKQSTMQNGFDIWEESDMFVCKTTFEKVLYQGRGHFGECCFYYRGGEKCIWNDPNTLYLSWLG
ncbi:hypothetical protein IW147_002439 [Coemansia sp. RSA 720]|nr:hypothetical protein LPJ76_005319 [Coemansia sp. RSA 638]KAJ2123690.1 hypothetical protein IW147_002439 [Coemansia sp. RSA 720]KAJ2539556.1 hypothetical protein GGF49_005126 [Coemansia sp. RSA 1853]